MPIHPSRTRRLAIVVAALFLAGCSDDNPVVAPLPSPPPDPNNIAPIAAIRITSSCTDDATLTAEPGTHDDDGTIVLYQWDFEDDGVIDAAGPTLTTVTHRYGSGSYRAKLIVTDDDGVRGADADTFTVRAPDTLYVSPTTGFADGPGTRTAPFSTLDKAFRVPLRVPGCQRVTLVASGTYDENVEFPTRTRVIGGRDPLTWNPAAGQRSIVRSPASGTVPNGQQVTIVAFEFRSPDANFSAMSLGFRVSSTQDLRFENCRFVAGRGGTGANGLGRLATSGHDGGPGEAVTGGTPGRTVIGPGPGTPVPGESGGRGGEGATPSTAATFGQDGQPLSGGLPARGGSPASSCADAVAQNGENGADGAAGSNGESVTLGTFEPGWTPGQGRFGTAGQPGGGGGGGGGALYCSSAEGTGSGAGGGGGEGGYPGLGGGGGGQGGPSVAVFLSHGDATFVDCEFVTAGGGEGGIGGNGAPSSSGGEGGPGFDGPGPSRGGNGGDGGRGGAGGGGRGGPGGPSYAVVLYDGDATMVGSTSYDIGPGGAGGVGGYMGDGGPQALPGPPGERPGPATSPSYTKRIDARGLAGARVRAAR